MQVQSRLPATLAELFSTHSGRQGMGAPRLSASEQDKLRAVFKGKQPFAFADVEQGVRDAYRGALDVNLMDIFLPAWAKVSAIAAFANANEYPSDERHYVPLREHRVTSSHEPRVEVLIDGVEVFSLGLEVKLQVDFEAAALEIAEGRICAVKSASCRALGSIACQGVNIASIKTGNMTLPGEIKLKPPFSLSPFAAGEDEGGLTLSGFDEAGRLLKFRLQPTPRQGSHLVDRPQAGPCGLRYSGQSRVRGARANSLLPRQRHGDLRPRLLQWHARRRQTGRPQLYLARQRPQDRVRLLRNAGEPRLILICPPRLKPAISRAPKQIYPAFKRRWLL